MSIRYIWGVYSIGSSTTYSTTYSTATSVSYSGSFASSVSYNPILVGFTSSSYLSGTGLYFVVSSSSWSSANVVRMDIGDDEDYKTMSASSYPYAVAARYDDQGYATSFSNYCYSGSGTWRIDYVSSSSVTLSLSSGGSFRRYYRTSSTSQYPMSLRSYVSSSSSSTYPSYGTSGSYYYVAETQDVIDPDGLTIPDLIYEGDTITITIDPSADAEANAYGTISYVYQYTLDGYTWQTLTTTSATSTTFEVPVGAESIRFRVYARDSLGFTSSTYVYSNVVYVSIVGGLTISDEDRDLGEVNSNIPFTVSSEYVSKAHVVIACSTVSMKMDVDMDVQYYVNVLDLLSGSSNTVTITASATINNEEVTETRTYTYSKTAVSFPDSAELEGYAVEGRTSYPLMIAEGIKVGDSTLDQVLDSINARILALEKAS